MGMEFPPCPNFVKRRGCERSALVLRGEQDDSWTFECQTCKLVWVVSKPTEIVRSRLFQAEEEKRRQAEAHRRRDSRTKFFT